MLVGVLILFGVIFIIVKAVQGPKSETVRRIDANGNESIETHISTEPTAGTKAARGTLTVVAVIVGLVVFVFLGLMAF